jgi:hypothetical protein
MQRTVRYFAAAAALGLFAGAFAASPATAKPDQKPIDAKMALTLNLFQCPDDGPFVTWTGTVVINGDTYGWADEPLAFPDPPPQPNDNFWSFEENWTIFTLEEGEDPHIDASLACDESRVVMAGDNTGWANPAVAGKAEGDVTYVADPGPFDNVELGSRMFWNGKAPGYSATTPCCAPGAKWKATLHIS